jgi:hypothetical protein
MTRRLATMCIVTMFLIGIKSPSVEAQASNPEVETLKSISAVNVVVEDLHDGRVAQPLSWNLILESILRVAHPL